MTTQIFSNLASIQKIKNDKLQTDLLLSKQLLWKRRQIVLKIIINSNLKILNTNNKNMEYIRPIINCISNLCSCLSCTEESSTQVS